MRACPCMVLFPVRIYYESATYGSAISHRRSSVRARAPGLARPSTAGLPTARPGEPGRLSNACSGHERDHPVLAAAWCVIGGRVRELVPVRVFAHEPHRGFEPTAARFMMRDLTGLSHLHSQARGSRRRRCGPHANGRLEEGRFLKNSC